MFIFVIYFIDYEISLGEVIVALLNGAIDALVNGVIDALLNGAGVLGTKFVGMR